MRKVKIYVFCMLLLVCFILPPQIRATEVSETTESDLWSREFSRIMDITDSLTKDEIYSLDLVSTDCLEKYQLDVAIATIPKERLKDDTMEAFAKGLYQSCDFGYGETQDGFMCLYIEDTQELFIQPMGNAKDVFPRQYLDYIVEKVPSLRENNGVYGVVYGCQELIRSGLETLRNKAEAEEEDIKVEDLKMAAPQEDIVSPQNGDFERCGKGQERPEWFPKNLDEAYVYFDEDMPRVVDYAGIISDECEEVMKARIAEISDETGKDIVIVTDVSNYGLGDDMYAADFYDFNGYGIGEEHEGMVLFLDMNPEERGGWTAETGSLTRDLMRQGVANRLDDFLYETLATGDYDKALSDWIEDVYSVYTVGIARPPFWYEKDLENSDYYNPDAEIVVDEWGLLSAEQVETLKEKARYLKDNYGVNAYFHTTHDKLGLNNVRYNNLYMAGMGYEKDAVLFSIENSGMDQVKYLNVYLYGDMKDRIPNKFLSRIENNASAADGGYGRLFDAQRRLLHYLKTGRVPRNRIYWTMITILSALIGLVYGGAALSRAEDSMRTVSTQTSAYSYLDRKNTKAQKLSETFLYRTLKRVYIPPKNTSSSYSSSSGSHSSSYKSSYTGHSGTTHTGHGRKF